MSYEKSRFLESLGRSLSKSFGGSMNKSFTQPGFLEYVSINYRAYYNFQYSNVSPQAMATPSRDLAHFAGLEDQFCKDFSCCGIQLNDLHELLQHFEENHVVIEGDDMDEDDDLQFQFETGQDVDMHDNLTPYSDIYLNKKTRNPSTQSQQSVALSDIYSTDSHALSAFETSIIRKRASPPSDSPWRQQASDSPPRTFPVVLDDQEVPPAPAKAEKEVTKVGGKEVKDDRPYKCKVVGCTKAYKNPGGLKYHMHHGHCEDTGDPEMNNIIHKPYQCTVTECGKRYKNLNGLKVHFIF